MDWDNWTPTHKVEFLKRELEALKARVEALSPKDPKKDEKKPQG